MIILAIILRENEALKTISSNVTWWIDSENIRKKKNNETSFTINVSDKNAYASLFYSRKKRLAANVYA
jgi:hypothetical protein